MAGNSFKQTIESWFVVWRELTRGIFYYKKRSHELSELSECNSKFSFNDESCYFILSLFLSLSISLISFRNNRNNIKRQIVDSGTSDIKSEDRSKVQLSIGPIAF